jgi:hypothetical protein
VNTTMEAAPPPLSFWAFDGPGPRMLRAATAGHSLPHPTHGPGPGLSIAEHKTHQAKSPRFQGIDILRFQAPLTPVNNDTFTASRQGKRAGRTTFDRRDPFSEEKPTIVGRSPVCGKFGKSM